LKWFSDPKIQKWSVGFVCLLWYVPYIHARTSSENLSTSFFIFGLATLVLSERILWIHALVAGLCFGLSFEFRFQLIFMIAGLMAWAIYTRKLSTKCFLVLTGSGLSVATAALVIDRWGYGQWTFVLWRYFSANFIDGALNEFGIQPWWFYLRFLLIVLPPLSSILALLAIAGFFRKALQPVTWACGPFIVFHLLVGHKEPRFLFPVFLTAPMMAFYGLSKSRIFNFVSAYKNWCYFFLFANFVVLLHLAMTSSKRQVGVYRSLYQEIKAPFKYYVLGEDPFEPSGLKPHYYGEVQRLGTLHSPDELMSLDAVRPFYLISDASLQNQVLKFSCQELWTNEPHIFSGDGLARWLRRFRVHSWFLYQCQKAPKLREEFSQ
jgi:phosphatidylinositol glycan class B